MSNDMSNEQGNAAQAFQVGDRVRYHVNPQHEHGIVIEPDEPGMVLVEMAADSIAPGARIHYRPDQLEVISRATPAPAQTDYEPVLTQPVDISREAMHAWNMACYRDNVPPFVALNTLIAYAARVGANAAVDMLAPPASEPATPAPTAMEPRDDTHTLEVRVMMPCPHCRGAGTFRGTNVGRCAECDGDGWYGSAVRLSSEALDRLAAALVARLPGIVRMRPNASGK